MPSNKPGYQKKYFKQWYEKNKEKHKRTSSIRRDAQRKENQQRLIGYLLTHPCVDCGETDVVVLQFDHVHGKKRKEISGMMDCSWASIEAEIAKCDVRCANDHARKTAKSQKNFKLAVSVHQFEVT